MKMNKAEQEFGSRHKAVLRNPERHCRLCFINKKPYIFDSFKTDQYSHLIEVLAFAESNKLNLPKDYIDLLAFANGGYLIAPMIPGPADWSGGRKSIEYCLMEAPLPKGISREGTSILTFYSFIRSGEISKGWISILNAPKDLEKGFLVFAEDRNYAELKYLLICSGSDAGSVYVFNEQTNKKSLVNTCFTDFMESFTLVPPVSGRKKPWNLLKYLTHSWGYVPVEEIPNAREEEREHITFAKELALCTILNRANSYCQNKEKAESLRTSFSIFEKNAFREYHKLEVQNEAQRLVTTIFGSKESRVRKEFSLECSISPEVADHLFSLLMGLFAAFLNHECSDKSYLYFIGTVKAQMEYISEFLIVNDQYVSAYAKLSSI